jgi:hypothetical protein
MNPSLILQLVELALALAQSQLKGADLEQTLVQIIQKGVTVYQDEAGRPLDPKLVGVLDPL